MNVKINAVKYTGKICTFFPITYGVLKRHKFKICVFQGTHTLMPAKKAYV